MPTREYYLRQAEVLFELASKMSLKLDAEQLISRANEYQMLADVMPVDLPAMPGPPRTAVTQPMQQQQQQNIQKDEIGHLSWRPLS